MICISQLSDDNDILIWQILYQFIFIELFSDVFTKTVFDPCIAIY